MWLVIVIIVSIDLLIFLYYLCRRHWCPDYIYILLVLFIQKGVYCQVTHYSGIVYERSFFEVSQNLSLLCGKLFFKAKCKNSVKGWSCTCSGFKIMCQQCNYLFLLISYLRSISICKLLVGMLSRHVWLQG